MAGKKINLSSDFREKPRGKPGRSRLAHIIRRSLVAAAILVVVLWWFWADISAWFNSVAGGAVGLFGWGLLLLAISLGILIGLIRFRKLSSLIYHWNRWLAGIAFILAIWGILARLGFGGSFGISLISEGTAIGILRIVGLIIAGIVLLAPMESFHVAKDFVSWLKKGFERKRVPAPSPAEKPTVSASPKLAQEREAVTQAQPDLRQVAQEVWKKYGESPALVTIDGWRLPPIDILDKSPEVEFSEADNIQRARLIEEALASYGVEAKVVQINAGPTVTQFGVEPGWDRKMRGVKEKDKDGNVRVRQEEVSKTRVKVDRIIALSNDLALSLAASSIRIEAPVPGQSVVGIEVPNTISSSVSLRGVIETSAFQKTEAKSKLALSLGKSAGGESVAADLAKMPHLLIAGATGSGKTVCLNTIISCLLMHNTPYEVRFIMVDPKRVELTPYNSIPHLATPVIVDTNKAISALRWLSQEMDKRYEKFAATTVRNIDGYNKNKPGSEKLPCLIVIIDELADLMMAGFDEVEHLLCRLAQLARATGIHLVVATQRPSVDVVTGLIKANFPTRISFAVTSQVDSRTILDTVGAEKLLGRGDMLYMPTEAAKPKRLQGCFVSDPEIERLVYFWNSQRKEEPATLKVEELVSAQISARRESLPEDPLLAAARQLKQEHGHISTSFLQRRLRIGYPRAARIMEQLEEEDAKGGERSG